MKTKFRKLNKVNYR